MLIGISGLGCQSVFAQRSGYICGDFHQHTTYTDGSYSFDYVMKKNDEFDLDWWANSEHGGYRERDGRYSGNDCGTTVFWDSERVNILGDTIYSNNHQAMWRWQCLTDYSFISILKARKDYPDKTIIQGFEWNVPGHEHASVGIITGQFRKDPRTVALSEFEYKFDDSDNDHTGDTTRKWKKSALSGHEKTIEAIAWMQKHHQYQSWVIPAHPERSASYDINHFRDMNNAGPDVCFGFESMPGHQKSSCRGGYSSSSDGGGTYGGCGFYAAKIGGLWDALLSEGRHWWLFASSDFHDIDSDFWPGEYQKTYTWATNKHNHQEIVNALRSGNSWIVEGDLIDKLNFSASQSQRWYKEQATMGQTLQLKSNELIIRILVNDPQDTNNFGNNPMLDHIDLIMGQIKGIIQPGDSNYTIDEVSTTKIIARFDANGDVTDENGLTSIAWKRYGPGKILISYRVKNISNSCYFRLRGTNIGLNKYNETDANGNPLLDSLNQNTFNQVINDLWFYSNPIFVHLKKKGYQKSTNDIFKSASDNITENNTELPQYRIYPNPTTDYITFENNNVNEAEINITDLSGKILKVIHTSGPTTDIDITELPSGLFIALIKLGSRVESFKFSKY